MSKNKNADYRVAAQQLEVLIAELLEIESTGGDTSDVEERIAEQEEKMEKIRADRKAAGKAARDTKKDEKLVLKK